MMLVPNPLRVGGVTIGPPDSIQRKLSLPSAIADHATRVPVVARPEPRSPVLSALDNGGSCNGKRPPGRSQDRKRIAGGQDDARLERCGQGGEEARQQQEAC